jgi:hypothetical protein
MSTPSYLIAHRALPLQAGTRPAELWNELSGPGRSTWLAMVAHKLQVKVRHIGVEGAPLGRAVMRRDGFELLAMYFPAPEASGEPYYAVLARRQGETKLRSFVFERGSSGPGEPLRVVMAEWTARSANDVQRMRFDAAPDASLEACITRTLAELKHEPAPMISAPVGRPGDAAHAAAPSPPSRNVVWIVAAVVIAIAAVFFASRL